VMNKSGDKFSCSAKYVVVKYLVPPSER
jgi:hypothetical protein